MRYKGYSELQSKKIYRMFLAHMPIACVDIVVRHRGNFLLVKRARRPARGKWWFPGGRIMKGETLHKAVGRKVREETGLRRFTVQKILTTYETMFPDSEFGPSTHSVNVVFLVRVEKAGPLRRDAQSTDIRWFSRVDPRWPRYVKEMLARAGFTPHRKRTATPRRFSSEISRRSHTEPSRSMSKSLMRRYEKRSSLKVTGFKK